MIKNVLPQQQIEFSKRFGEIDIYVLSEYTLARYPEVLLISNVQKNGKNIGLADAGTTWHTDTSYLKRPTACHVFVC